MSSFWAFTLLVFIIGILRGNRYSIVLRLIIDIRVPDGKMISFEKKNFWCPKIVNVFLIKINFNPNSAFERNCSLKG